MRHVAYALQTPNSVTTGAAQRIADLRDKSVQVHGTFVATVAIEGRIGLPDGTFTPWQSIASVTTPGFTQIPQAISEIRMNTTAFTSGDPEAVVAGYDENG